MLQWKKRQILWWQGSPNGIPMTIQKTMMRGLRAVCIADVIMKFICFVICCKESKILW
jgi:hypothetical protein